MLAVLAFSCDRISHVCFHRINLAASEWEIKKSDLIKKKIALIVLYKVEVPFSMVNIHSHHIQDTVLQRCFILFCIELQGIVSFKNHRYYILLLNWLRHIGMKPGALS